jgi:DNA-binding transcriptional regulator YiaG
MPNIASVLKQEIARIARKEMRLHVRAMKKAATQHRQHIAILKKRVSGLESQLYKDGQPIRKPESPTTTTRFSAKGIKSLRSKLGFSGANLAQLVGVSVQSIYNWEHEIAKPRAAQLSSLAALRGIGKREAARRLAELTK